MDYSGDLAAIQQELARSFDMAARRVRVVEALGPVPGERIVEVGCGGGLLLREVGRAVGESGAAVGFDLSADQVAAARELCADLPQVTVDVGDARRIAAADDSFDASVTTQVLEYVPDVDAAIAELARVTRPGGRFLNVATNWGSLFWIGGDEDLTERVLRAWDRHAPHPNLPVALPGRLAAAGFGGVRQTVLTLMNRHIRPGTWCHGAARLLAAFARTEGQLDEEAADAWLRSLERADVAGDHFVTVVAVATTATCLA